MADIAEAPSLYEVDEYAWVQHQIAALRSGDLDHLDCSNLAAYLTDMAARDRRELKSRLTVLAQHILKFRHQPAKAGRSWRLTVLTQQREIASILDGSPTLRRQANDVLRAAHPAVIKAAVADTGLDAAVFGTNPLTLDEVMGFDALQER